MKNKTHKLSLWLAVIALVFCGGAFAQNKGKSSMNAAKLETAYFAMGCFWKTQFVFSKVPGVVETRVGYTGGKTANPNYKDVCGDGTGHAEAVKVVFDPAKVSYRQLLELFWAKHDPTTKNRQGLDIGTQYRSAVFYTSPEQLREATSYKAELEKSRRYHNPIVTELVPATSFYDAEDYHQNYFVKHGAVCN
jgi:peptide-methionine (S)-S-oxide reductase